MDLYIFSIRYKVCWKLVDNKGILEDKVGFCQNLLINLNRTNTGEL